MNGVLRRSPTLSATLPWWQDRTHGEISCRPTDLWDDTKGLQNPIASLMRWTGEAKSLTSPSKVKVNKHVSDEWPIVTIGRWQWWNPSWTSDRSTDLDERLNYLCEALSKLATGNRLRRVCPSLGSQCLRVEIVSWYLFYHISIQTNGNMKLSLSSQENIEVLTERCTVMFTPWLSRTVALGSSNLKTSVRWPFDAVCRRTPAKVMLVFNWVELNSTVFKLRSGGTP